jgi:hypothetical protein
MSIITEVFMFIKGFEDLFKFVDPPVFLRYLGSTGLFPGLPEPPEAVRSTNHR